MTTLPEYMDDLLDRVDLPLGDERWDWPVVAIFDPPATLVRNIPSIQVVQITGPWPRTALVVKPGFTVFHQSTLDHCEKQRERWLKALQEIHGPKGDTDDEA